MRNRLLCPNAAACIASAFILFSPATAYGQSDDSGVSGIALAATLGSRGLGVGLHARLFAGVGVVGRYTVIGPLRIRSAGFQILVLETSDGLRIYGLAVIGESMCTGLLSRTDCGVIQMDWHAGSGISAGTELMLDSDLHWSAGIELGYWRAFDDNPRIQQLSEFTGGLILRRHF